MKQEEKELLLKDLCARLPYKVYAQMPDEYGGYTSTIESIDIDGFVKDSEGAQIEIKYVKPYLFPMSSMTEEQKKECNFADDLDSDILDVALCANHYHRTGIPTVTYNLVDWCNKNHFDYRGLIPMGLANDATGLNIY